MRLGIALLSLTACGGGSTDIDPTLAFADRTDAEIARLISAASGTDMFSAQANVDRFADGVDPCPAISISGSIVTVSGACTTADQVEIQGTVTITNPTAWDQVDFRYGDDTTYDFDAFVVGQVGFRQSFDGTIRIEGLQTWDADLVTASMDVEIRSDLHYECSGSSCDLSGSGVEWIGAGGALVSGEVQVTGTQRAAFTLRGRDTLTADVLAGCVAWQISGSERQKVCAP